jgi:hypothetical protein
MGGSQELNQEPTNSETFMAEDRQLFLKVIACEIAFRELCYTAARSRNLIDFEFLTQGHHDKPCQSRLDLQQRVDAVPDGKYDAIVLGYGLCSNLLAGLTSAHTRLVIPRAHDCITLFLGSKQRYQELFDANPGTYYYTSGWLECRQRRGASLPESGDIFMPAALQAGIGAAYQQCAAKYGEEKARYLAEAIGQWSAHYTRGVLIDYEFTKSLRLRTRVQKICADRGWQFAELDGDLGMFQRLLDGDWQDQEVLVLRPGQMLAATYDENIIAATDQDRINGPNLNL